MKHQADNPITKEDKRLRVKHTSDSVKYNLNHITDHKDNMIVAVQKLSTVNPGLAKNLAKFASSQLGSMKGAVDKFSGAKNLMKMHDKKKN